jgi:hypothetical protein
MQATWHCPAAHTALAPPVSGQALPHAPQFMLSFCKSKQAPPHCSQLSSHEMSQSFLAHVGVPWGTALQVAPQPPQLTGSVSSVTHSSPHKVWP